MAGASNANASAWSAMAGGSSPRPPSAAPAGGTPAKLRDGSRVLLRAPQPADEQLLLEFLTRLCDESQRMRFFTGAANLSSAAHWAANVDASGDGILAFDPDGRLVAHAAYAPIGPERAEVALEVADSMQGLGLGTILVELLAEHAERAGIRTFVAEVLPENRMMLDVFRCGFDANVAFEKGTDLVQFPTSAWRLAAGRFLD